MTVQTSFTARTLPTVSQHNPSAHTVAMIQASDPILDGIAFSRGRFTIGIPNLPMLVIPAWPEPARVIEDCRR
jgi:hypothetical protein